MTDDHDAVYEKLKDIFRCARKTLDPNLDDQQLSKIGVDASRFDLAKETSQGGQFFRPMSQKVLSGLHKRRDMPNIASWEDDFFLMPFDHHAVQNILEEQISCSRDEDDEWQALDSTKWTGTVYVMLMVYPSLLGKPAE